MTLYVGRAGRTMSAVLALASIVLGAACGPDPHPCEVITLDQVESLRVISRYGRSYLDTDCEQAIPREVIIPGTGYEVYLLLRANQPAQGFIGVRPHESSRFVLNGHAFKPGSPDSVFRDRASHNFRLPSLVANQLTFQVTDLETGKSYSHAFTVGSVRCTCKTYDGL